MSFEGNWQLTISSPMGERPASLSITETTGNLEGVADHWNGHISDFRVR